MPPILFLLGSSAEDIQTTENILQLTDHNQSVYAKIILLTNQLSMRTTCWPAEKIFHN